MWNSKDEFEGTRARKGSKAGLGRRQGHTNPV